MSREGPKILSGMSFVPGVVVNRARIVLAATVAISSVFAGSVVAYADPDAVEQARQDLERIHQESSAIDQSIIEAHDRAAQNEAKLKTLNEDVAAQEAKVAELSAQLGDITRRRCGPTRSL